MTLRILYSAMFIKEYFKVWQLTMIWFTIIWCKYWEWFSYLKLLFPQGSSSFSFRGCLPSGWIIVLLSGVITLISENVFLDQHNFWQTFMIHFSVGLACFCVSSYVMYIFSFHLFQLLWYFCWLQLFIITSFFVNILLFLVF